MRLLLSLLLLFVAGPATAILPKIGFPKVDPNRFIPEPPEIPTTNEGFQALLNDTEFVFGGQLAQPGNFPYQVFFTYYKRDGNPYICGGSLISPTHVLTAAHCTIGVVAPARIMVGATNTRQQGAPAQWRNVQSINAHPYYRDGDPSFPNDIAILGFSPPVQIGGSVGLVRILADDSQLLSAGSAIISGFGTYAFNGGQSITSDYLRYATLQVYNSQYCRQQWAGFTNGRTQVTTAQLCAGGRGRGSGPGDSGGPLSVNTQSGLFQVGLVSFGPVDPTIMSQQQDQVPAVFTRLASHCDFIQSYSGGTARCQGAVTKPDCTFVNKW